MSHKKRIGERSFLDLCASKKSDVAVRKALETQPELVECRDVRVGMERFTPLHHACLRGRTGVVRVLLEYDADVNAQRKHAVTPLHHASSRGHEEVARLLLEHGAEVNAGNTEGSSPLQFASCKGHSAVVQLQLEHGAEVDASSSNGWTALHVASFNRHQEVVRVLLEHGADANLRNNQGATPLHLVLNTDSDVLARLLIEHGADRSIKDNDGETARDVAARRGKLKVVEVLDTYFPIPQQLVQVLLGMRGPTESSLTRFAAHSAFEPKVLSLVKCLLTGEGNAAFEQLQREV